jgi:hypothetical protein
MNRCVRIRGGKSQNSIVIMIVRLALDHLEAFHCVRPIVHTTVPSSQITYPHEEVELVDEEHGLARHTLHIT